MAEAKKPAPRKEPEVKDTLSKDARATGVATIAAAMIARGSPVAAALENGIRLMEEINERT